MDSINANANSNGGRVHDHLDDILGSRVKPQKLIIDTDPGIDDSMAILMAFQAPELEILGLTTIFGNVATEDATRNALLLDSVRWQAVRMFLLLRVALSEYEEDNGYKICDSCSCVESVIRDDTCGLFLRSMIEEWKIRIEDHQMEILICEELHQLIMVEFIKEAYKESMHPTKNNTRENRTSVTTLEKDLKVQREYRLIKLFQAMSKCFEAEEDLMLSARGEMREHSKELDLGSERDFLHEHEIFEDLFAEEEQTCYSVANKLEKALQQLARGKELLYELGSTLGLRPCGLVRTSSLPTRTCSLEKTRDRVSPVLSIAQSSSHTQQKHNVERTINPFSSLFLFLMGFPLVFAAFEQMVIEKLSATAMRLRETKCCLSSLVQLVAFVQEKEATYRRAFITRCQNLQKAENEVDMLGDQVDALLSLLEKTYATLHQYAPVLEQYFEASELLELIKKEIT